MILSLVLSTTPILSAKQLAKITLHSLLYYQHYTTIYTCYQSPFFISIPASCKHQYNISSKSQQFHQLSSTMNQHFMRQTGFRPVQLEFFLSPKHKCPQILLKDLVHYFWCKQVLVMHPRYFGVTPP